MIANWPKLQIQQHQVLLSSVLSPDLSISDLQKMGLTLPTLEYRYNLTIEKEEPAAPPPEPTFPVQPDGYSTISGFLANDDKMSQDLIKIQAQAKKEFGKDYKMFDIVPDLSFYKQDSSIMISLVIVTNTEATEYIHATYQRDYGIFGGYSFENLQVTQIIKPEATKVEEKPAPLLPSYDC